MRRTRWYNQGVRPSRQTLRLVLVTLLGMIFVIPTAFSRVTVNWFCEGRVCGYTLLYCCCESPVGRDAQCGTVVSPVSSPTNSGTSLCPSPCDCRMVIDRVDDPPEAVVLAPIPFYPLLLALLPSTPSIAPSPYFHKYTTASLVARGPPVPPSLASAPSSPRAPPLS
ncbi:MAG: hypothetical protein V4671_33885 [Armatimonadota bacterium]